MADKQTLYFDKADTVWSIIIPRGIQIPVTAELLGGGGGGGGADAYGGGSGAAGQYLKYDFTVSKGDVLSFVVGGGGSAGKSSTRSAGGGAAGSSVVALPKTVFNTAYTTSGTSTTIVTDTSWSYFMNKSAIWSKDGGLTAFERTYDFNAPITDDYQVAVQCRGFAKVYIDGNLVASTSRYQENEEIVTVRLTKGAHTVKIVASRILNFFQKSGVAVEITNGPGSDALLWQESLSGGRGGNAGTSGSSGGGGGGGGASAILLNGEIIAIAGGGGGAGGGGRYSSGSSASNTPNSNSKFYNGQRGQAERADGGGGGGGGGGYRAGNGGTSGKGDAGGTAGQSAGCWALPNEWNSIIIHNGSGRTPYTNTTAGAGGSPSSNGSPGFIRFEFDTSVCSYKVGDSWEDISRMFIKDAGTWRPVEAYVKVAGEWQPITRRDIAQYKEGNGIVGVYDRDNPMRPPPPPPPPTYEYYGGGSYSSGSSYYGSGTSRVTDSRGNPVNAGGGGIVNSSYW